MPTTSLSAGSLLRTLLQKNETVAGMVTKIFPVVADEARLPYVAYRRLKLLQTPAKGADGADAVEVAVVCYAATYEGALALAEAVRAALDGCQGTDAATGLRLRSCTLIDAPESWDGDAYIEELHFLLRLG